MQEFWMRDSEQLKKKLFIMKYLQSSGKYCLQQQCETLPSMQLGGGEGR